MSYSSLNCFRVILVVPYYVSVIIIVSVLPYLLHMYALFLSCLVLSCLFLVIIVLLSYLVLVLSCLLVALCLSFSLVL